MKALPAALCAGLLVFGPLGCDKKADKAADAKGADTKGGAEKETADEKVDEVEEAGGAEDGEKKEPTVGGKKNVFFDSPKDGDTVTPKFKIVFGVDGKEVVAADDTVDEGKGHHHIIVDGEPSPAGTVVAKDATHIHYGDGRTETEIELEAGTHTLTMQFANGKHESYGPDWAATITVEVKEGAEAPGAQ